MADLGIIALGAYTDAGSTSSTGSDPLLEVILSTDDDDFVFDATNTDHTGVASFALGATPADFGTILTVSVTLRYSKSAHSVDKDWLSLAARIFKSDGTTALTDQVTVASNINATTLVTSSVIPLTTPDTAATKAEWDAAVVHLFFEVNRDKGGTGDEFRVVAGEITGTYTVASNDTTIAATATGTAVLVAQFVLTPLTALSQGKMGQQNSFHGPFQI